MSIKVKIHSIVDLITNSSTVIFTYQNSIDQVKDLVNEVLKLSGSNETPDDIFYYGVFCSTEIYTEYEDDYCEEETYDEVKKLGWKEKKSYIKNIIEQILVGKIEKPQWMINAENNDDDGCSWAPDSYLHIIPKDEKYNDLAKKIKALLNSVSADGGRDG